MKTVEVQYFAILREARGLDHERVATTATNCRALYESLAASHQLPLKADQCRVAVNDRFVALEDAFEDGDRITFIPPVAGG